MAIIRYEGTAPTPESLVTVYLHNTQELAEIFADPEETPLGNPFTADAETGVMLFYADNGEDYDLLIAVA